MIVSGCLIVLTFLGFGIHSWDCVETYFNSSDFTIL